MSQAIDNLNVRDHDVKKRCASRRKFIRKFIPAKYEIVYNLFWSYFKSVGCIFIEYKILQISNKLNM